MKKLITLASMAAVACSLQAGSFIWGFANGADDPAGSTGWMDSGATALLYLGTVSFDASSGWDLSSATLVDTAGYDSISDNGFGHLATTDLQSNSGVDTAGGQTYSLVLVDAEGVTDLAGYTGDGKNYVLVSGLTSGSRTIPGVGGNPDTTYAVLTSDDFVSSSDWQSAATSASPEPPTPGVPEPTSGLLLVMGLAGLALKRKRA